MAGNAFTAGVKPGGLTTSTEIRILLCYLIQHAGTPLSQGELETALLGEELVNYFELASNLSDLLEQGFVREENGRYTILPAGADIAEALADDVPRSVRDAAVRATLAAQQFARKEAQHHAQITPAASGTGYNVQCSIRDMESDVFSFSLYVPDKLTAKLARAQFIENGDGIYKLMLAALTSNDALVAELLKKSTNLCAVRHRQKPAGKLPPVFAAEQKHVLCRPYIPKPPAAFPPVPPSPIDKTVPAC